jgi:hypothetical protein
MISENIQRRYVNIISNRNIRNSRNFHFLPITLFSEPDSRNIEIQTHQKSLNKNKTKTLPNMSNLASCKKKMPR